jgi:hypothetical protein
VISRTARSIGAFDAVEEVGPRGPTSDLAQKAPTDDSFEVAVKQAVDQTRGRARIVADDAR